MLVVVQSFLIPSSTNCTAFGYSDIENGVLCRNDTVMRIASISKCLTMAAVAKLWQTGKLSMDEDVKCYVPSFPVKMFADEEV